MLRFHRGAVKSVKCALMLGASDSPANPQRSDHQVLLPLCTPHTHKHTYAHTHTPAHTTHLHTLTRMHTPHTHLRAYHTYAHTTHTHTTLALMHTPHTLTHMCTLIHMRTHTHSHAHTQTHARPHIRLAVRQALQADLISLQLPHSAPLITSLRNGLFICKTRFIMPSLQG